MVVKSILVPKSWGGGGGLELKGVSHINIFSIPKVKLKV